MKNANSIAEESDLILGVFRNDVLKPPEHELAILKQRNGPTLDYYPVEFNREEVQFRERPMSNWTERGHD